MPATFRQPLRPPQREIEVRMRRTLRPSTRMVMQVALRDAVQLQKSLSISDALTIAVKSLLGHDRDRKVPRRSGRTPMIIRRGASLDSFFTLLGDGTTRDLDRPGGRPATGIVIRFAAARSRK